MPDMRSILMPFATTASACANVNSSTSKLSPPSDYDAKFPDNNFATSTELNPPRGRSTSERDRSHRHLIALERRPPNNRERGMSPNQEMHLSFSVLVYWEGEGGVDMDAGKIDTDDDITIEKMTTTASLTRPSHSINHQNELRKRAAKARNGMDHKERKPYVEEAKWENE